MVCRELWRSCSIASLRIFSKLDHQIPSLHMHVFDKRILNKGLGTIFQSLLVGIKVASDIQTEQFSATEFDLFQALNPESTSWRSFDSPIHRKLVKNLHHQKVSVKSVATPWEHTSSRYRTSTVNRLTQAD